MKIAFINQPWDSAVPPIQSGSIPIWTYQVARRLAQSEDVIIYARKNRQEKQVEWHEGVQYRRVSVAFDRVLNGLLKLFARLRHPKRPHFADNLYYLGYVLQVAKDLREQKCDIVHIHNFSQFVPIIRALNPNIKVVLHMHCEWLTQLDHAMIERRLGQVDLMIGCSQYITEKICRRFPEFASRFQTIYNGVDTNHLISKNGHSETKGDGGKRLLFVGRVSPEKGVHVLLDAFEKIVRQYPQAQLKIVGPEAIAPREFIVALSNEDKVTDLASFYSGSYLSHLKGRLSPELASQVFFTGSVPHSQLVNHYWDADVLINPSVSEAFGMSLAEAMACEVPVVAARVGGMTEVIEEGKTGILFEPADASALAEAILYLLKDEALSKSMGKAGRQRVLELFSWEKVAESLLCEYKNIDKSQKLVWETLQGLAQERFHDEKAEVGPA